MDKNDVMIATGAAALLFELGHHQEAASVRALLADWVRLGERVAHVQRVVTSECGAAWGEVLEAAHLKIVPMDKGERARVAPCTAGLPFVAHREFRECPTCAAKTGSPILCDSCLNNRAVITELERQLAEKEGGLKQ